MECWVAELVQVELREGFRGVLVVEWWAEVVVVWVRLGGEMGVICWVERALVSVEGKRRKS